jgi:hypothetical protein
VRSKLLSLVFSLGIVVNCIFSSIGVSAMSNVKPLAAPKNLQVTQTSANNYSLQVGNNVLHIGNPNVASSFSAKTDFPDWQGYAWNADLNLTMGVVGNAVAMAGMTSTSTSTSVTAGNSYFNITYSGVNANPPFNETGGLDMSITILKSVGNTLSFGYNSTNVNAYLQPSLTLEWTVGQDLGDGRTVASVTDTDVTDNLGNNVIHCPDYVVNSIAFYNATVGGTVTSAQSTTGLTTGKIGQLYALYANGVRCAWSISGNNLILTIPQSVINAGIYPIVLSPAGDTFGYTTAGAYHSDASGVMTTNGDTFTGAVGTGVSISAYTNPNNSLNKIQMCLYDASSNYVANGVTNTFTFVDWSADWHTANFTSAPTLSATGYYLVLNANDAIAWFFDYASTATYKYETETFLTWPGSASWSTTGGETRKYSIYCTYTSSSRTVTITSNAATLITANTVQLNGNLLDIADATSVVLTFDYGLTNAYGSTITAIESPLNANGTFSANVSSLVPANTYHFRAKGVS